MARRGLAAGRARGGLGRIGQLLSREGGAKMTFDLSKAQQAMKAPAK